MKVFRYKIKFFFENREGELEGILGSQPARGLAEEYLLGKAIKDGVDPKDEREALTVADALEKRTTVFHKISGRPVLFNYQIKGFFKEAANNLKDTLGITWPNARIAQGLFVFPRVIFLHRPDGTEITQEDCGIYERPLRAITMQGPRTSITRSEWIKAPIVAEVEAHLVGNKLDEKILMELLEYGKYSGVGQFRGGGFGTFSYALTSLQEEKPAPPAMKMKRKKAGDVPDATT